MAGAITRRRRAAMLAVAALATLALSACGNSGSNNKAESDSDAGANDASSQLGNAPAGSQTPAAAASSAGADGAAAGSGDGSPTYPTGPKAYAQALLKAWAKKDYTRLDQLAVTAAVQQIKDSITYGGLPNSNWHYILCDGAAGSTYCTFRNDNGDETVIRLTNSQIGHPAAVTEAPLDRTEYSDDPATYVGNFVSAWQHANRRRMLAYANLTVTNFVTHYPPLSAYTTCSDHIGGNTYQWVNGAGADAGSYYLFKIDKTKITAKAKHAITAAGIPGVAPPC